MKNKRIGKKKMKMKINKNKIKTRNNNRNKTINNSIKMMIKVMRNQ